MRRRTQAVVAPAALEPRGVTLVIDRIVDDKARPILTIGPDAKAWAVVNGETELDAAFTTSTMKGALVRLKPPASASDGRIVELEDLVRRLGAVAVKLDGRTRDDVHVVEAAAEPVPVRRTFAEVLEAETLKQPEELRAVARDIARLAFDEASHKCKKPIVPEATEPLWVARLELQNWFRYRAVDLALRPTAYGVVARMVNNPDRSNWIGKSTFLAAIAFLLEGWHPADYDEAFISPDADETLVRATLSDGSTIERSKRRGQAIKVVFVRKDSDGRRIVGEEAKDAIRRFIGLSEADYFASAFVRQKELARLVSGRSSDTLKIVSSWLDLAPFREAYRAVLDELNQTATEELEIAANIQPRAEIIARWLADFGATEPAELERQLDVEKVRAKETSEKVATLRAKVDEARRLTAAYHDRVREEAKLRAGAEKLGELEAKYSSLPSAERLQQGVDEIAPKSTAATEAWQYAAALVRDADKDLGQKKLVVLGAFDGKCPVAPPLVCPVREQINGDREPAKRAQEAAQKKRDELAVAAAKLAPEKSKWERELVEARIALNTAVQKKDAIEQEIKIAKQWASRLAAFKVGEPPASVEAEDIDPIVQAMTTAKSRTERLERAIAEIAREQKLEATFKVQRAELIAKAAHYRAAAAIIGPAGAMKQYAVAELAAIEAGANAVLEEASDELRVSIVWGYESPTALAPACASCGAGFPAASKAKRCPRCGAPRGPKVEEEVRITTNRISGAAEDLAGVAMQVSASSWLRTSRGSMWSSVAIDEPFGSLDVEHARAIGAKLGQLLAGRHGFRQSFVVAHSAAAMDAMPAKLVITGHPDGTSTIEEATG